MASKAYCKVHPTRSYDPAKYDRCWICFQKSQASKEGYKMCEECNQNAHKIEYAKCFKCFQKAAVDRSDEDIAF